MTGPHPAVAAVRRAVRRGLADLGQPDDGRPLVLVACSGGPDSLALAAATAFVSPRLGLRAGAVVVDHRLQPGSDVAAARAARTCRDLGLDPVDVVALPDTLPGSGPEDAARAGRYAALDERAAATGAVAVLLGHTQDDQAETVLLRLARGSGARSLAGMPERRGLLRRPLLGVTREQTEQVCAALGLDPWHDPTNAPSPGTPLTLGPEPSTHGPRPFVRARVRHEVLPALEDVLGPGVRPALARTAALLRQDAEVLEALARQLYDSARSAAADGNAAAGSAGAVDAARTHGADGPRTHFADGTPTRSADGTPTRSADAPRTHSADGVTPALDLDVATLATAPPALRHRALRLAALEAGAPAGDLGLVHVQALDALVVDWSGQGPAHLPGGIEAVRRYGRLSLAGQAPGDPKEHDR